MSSPAQEAREALRHEYDVDGECVHCGDTDSWRKDSCPTRLRTALDTLTRERDEARAEVEALRAELANERGEGESPSVGWTWDGDAWKRREWPILLSVSREDPSLDWQWVVIDCGEQAIKRIGMGYAPTARRAMLAADVALLAHREPACDHTGIGLPGCVVCDGRKVTP